MPLSVPGPYNPMAMVPARVAKRILDLEYMEMAEIAAEDDPAEDDPAQSIHWLPSRLVSPSNHEYIIVAGALLCDGGYFGHQISPKSPILVIYQRAE